MGSVNVEPAFNDEPPPPPPAAQMHGHLQKFRLYETIANYYMIGRDKHRTGWRVLKIDRLEPSELTVVEDPTTYSEKECFDLLKRIDEGNISTGGLRFISTFYGIIGFIKFLGPYYMLLITERKKIGTICGQAVYSITNTKMIPVPSSTVWLSIFDSKIEQRYKKLFRSVDLTKDFFFSYSYHVMRSFQKNFCDYKDGQFPYETLFVWNEFLTRGIRKSIQSTLWTVALVHGFFEQVKFSISGREFMFTLIARRSRHFAGTRYLRRGVNKKGRVANDVETEQIVFQEEHPMQISSVVQIRGSIPLFWSQESSRIKILPDIRLSNNDHNYEATKLHFENLVKRYGNPIIVLNLIKTKEKKPRESLLRADFQRAIELINEDLPKENRLKFLHWDLHKYSKIKRANVLKLLGTLARYASQLTGIFHCRITPTLAPRGFVNWSSFKQNDGDGSFMPHCPDVNEDHVDMEKKPIVDDGDASEIFFKSPQLQNGVLRTNCIDCLDRTNVAQYAYGLAALGHQLHSLQLVEVHSIGLKTPLAGNLMDIYGRMGDTVAQQYGGSGAHNKIFAASKGQSKVATQYEDFMTSVQRYYSNAYMDDVKQDAINVFLGYYQPQIGTPTLWELNSDQHFNLGQQHMDDATDKARPMKRSLSTGNIHAESSLANADLATMEQEIIGNQPFDKIHGSMNSISELTHGISTCENDVSCSRLATPSISRQHLFMGDALQEQRGESSNNWLHEHRNSYDLSNFLDVDWLSSCGEETYDGGTMGHGVESLTSASEYDTSSRGGEYARNDSVVFPEFSSSFVDWVDHGELFFK